MKNYNIHVVGTGFVGLTTALGFADKGFKVNCYDSNVDIVKNLNNDKIHFHENYLNKILKKNLNKNIFFSQKVKFIGNSHIVFICVGTPFYNSMYDLKFINDAISDVLKKIKNKNLILVIKSTALPGTCDMIIKKFNLKEKKNVSLVYNPEFLREGSAWKDFVKPEKIVIGCEDEKTSNIILKIYRKFPGKKIVTNFCEAEFVKIVANNLLSSLISFANFCSLLMMEFSNVNISRVFDIVKTDQRWFGKPAGMNTYFHPGPGYGGYCLPKDTKAFGNFAKKKLKKKNIILPLINDNVNNYIVNQYVKLILQKSKSFKKICILGMAFKPNTDDLRESVSVKIFNKLILRLKNKEIELFDNKVKFINEKKVNNKKIIFNKKAFYVLCTENKNYLSFLKKINKLNFLDTRNII